jgi:hypothetical protein
MLGKIRSPITIIASLVAIGTLSISAAASPASATNIGPHQYFVGHVHGLTAQGVIDVACAGVANTGHPLANQHVAVQEVFPPITSTTGYTGDSATQIKANLVTSTSGGVISIATFTQYTTEPIPTSIFVPCSGSGEMIFSPAPNVNGKTSTVNVKFISAGA